MFTDACEVIERALDGSWRRGVVAEAARARDLRTALVRLRDSMRSNVWKAGGTEINLGRTVRIYDGLTRRDGFHVMHDWDGIADRVNEDTIPVDVLNYLIDQRGDGDASDVALAVLLDYYFMHVLALLSLRVWDEGDADANLDRLSRLLTLLQGSGGSGQRFAADAETLLLLGTSHYEIDERGYDKLLERVRTLNQAHKTSVALGHAASMGSHLRFGFEATYARDTVIMRDDNVTDYPWLCFSLATLMREYARLRAADENVAGRDAIAEALVNGLSPDARAFVRSAPPASPAPFEAERLEFAELFRDAPGRAAAGVRALPPVLDQVLADLLLLQLLPQRRQGCGDRRAAERRAVAADAERPADDDLGRRRAERRQGEAGDDTDGVRAREPTPDPRPPDAGHRVRSRGGAPRVFGRDAEAPRIGDQERDASRVGDQETGRFVTQEIRRGRSS